MKKIVQYFIVFMLFISVISSYGQFYKLTRYADDNGLTSRMVRGSYQDDQGFLWVAGNNGLYKFDGQHFVSYFASLKDTTGLRGNKINTILQTKDQKIWVGTNKGLHFLENNHVSYKNLRENASDDENYILSLFEDKDQNLWIGTYGGLYIIEKSNQTIHYFSNKIPERRKSDVPFISEIKKDIIPKTSIWGISADKKGRIWLATRDTLYRFHENGDFSFKKIELRFNDGLKNKDINFFNYTVYNDSISFIGTSKGLLKGHITKDSILTVSNFKNKNGVPIATDFIENFIIDSQQNIWTATWRNYFKKYKIIDGKLIEQEVFIKNGFLNMSSNTTSIYEDSQKNIWVSNTNGLYKLSEDKGSIFVFPPRFIEDCFTEDLNVKSIVEDKGKHLWIATNTKLYRFDKVDVLQQKCPANYLLFENNHFKTINKLFIDSQDRLWVSANGGLSIAQLDEDYNPGKFKSYTKENGLPHNWTFDVFEKDKNTFWAANYIRLLKITMQNGDYNNLEIKGFDSSRDRPDALVNSFTFEIQNDSKNNIWIGTYYGISKLISDEDEGLFKNYTNTFGDYNSLSNNSIKNIFNDSNNNLWIGTQSGLNLFNENIDGFKQFGREDGLPSEYILGINEDSKGYLWVATTNGLFKAVYNKSMESFIYIDYYTKKDGLADNITNRNALYIDDEDNVFIGSGNGLSILEGVSETNNEVREFKMAITTIKSTQKNNQGFVSVKDRMKDDGIKLSHKENSIQLSYAVLDYTSPGYNQYRHKLLPVNEEWIETGNISELTYYNLSPGKYELILDGSNNQGIWSQQPIHIKVFISPPFWRSNFAYLLYVILLLGIIRLFYLSRVRKTIRELAHKSNLEKALVNEREQLRQENTADFHDELGSKVTKVSLYLTLAERSLKEQKDPSIWFSKIRSNTTDISNTFRDLLWVIDPKKDSLSDTFIRLKDFGEDLFNNTEIDFRTSGYNPDQTNFMLDPQTKKQVVLIFKEAMNNCTKYAESKRVNLILRSEIKYSSLELNDDGIGFDVNLKSKGRGLKNMMDRAKKIGADLLISSNGKGTSIKLVRIPHMGDEYSSEDV